MDLNLKLGELTVSTLSSGPDLLSLTPQKAAEALKTLRGREDGNPAVDSLVREMTRHGRYRIRDGRSSNLDVLAQAAAEGHLSVWKSPEVFSSCATSSLSFPDSRPQPRLTPHRPQPLAPEPTRVDFFVETQMDCQPITHLAVQVQTTAGASTHHTDSTGRLHFSFPDSEPVTVLALSGRFLALSTRSR